MNYEDAKPYKDGLRAEAWSLLLKDPTTQVAQLVDFADLHRCEVRITLVPRPDVEVKP